MARFEPRHCLVCGEAYIPTGPAQKYCRSCGVAIKRELRRLATARYRGGYKGRNQQRERNNHWRGGIGCYRDIARAFYPEWRCSRCGSTRYVCVHHKDGNRHNNAKNNLELLCRSCHQSEHGVVRFVTKPNKSTGYVGVALTRNGKYRAYFYARIDRQKKQVHIGTFDTLDAAAQARQRALYAVRDTSLKV